jgi:hypothetical protein
MMARGTVFAVMPVATSASITPLLLVLLFALREFLLKVFQAHVRGDTQSIGVDRVELREESSGTDSELGLDITAADSLARPPRLRISGTTTTLHSTINYVPLLDLHYKV